MDADALSRQAWDTREGDPWRPAARSEEVDDQRKELRAATNILVVGGDVGTEAHIEEEGHREGGGAHTGSGAHQEDLVVEVT